MKPLTILRISGIISFLFAIFHLAFPLMPNWYYALEVMPEDFAAIFITYHYIIIAFLSGMGYISIFRSKLLIDSPMKGSILLLFSMIYIIRIITEFVCWGITFPQSIIILVMCLIPLVCFLSVLFPKQEKSIN